VRKTRELASRGVELRVVAVAAKHLKLGRIAVVLDPLPQPSTASSKVVRLAMCGAIAVYVVELQEIEYVNRATGTLTMWRAPAVVRKHFETKAFRILEFWFRFRVKADRAQSTRLPVRTQIFICHS
jgi:hypothetical protein